jgi:hypothetical protein
MLRRAFLALSIVALCAPAYAAELEIGAKAPDLKGLLGTDGKEYNLADMKDKVVVVCFTCNICPWRWPMKTASSSSRRSTAARA